MAMTPINRLGDRAIKNKGWFKVHKWLLIRRVCQLSILAIFLLGPALGIWWVKGSLNSSLTLEVLPLSDPYVLLQTLFTGYWPQSSAIVGAVIVLIFYLLVGGRMYCSWVCPLNIVTDAAQWMRERLRIKSSIHFSRHTRYWILGLTLILASLSGSVVWELINPVSMIQRALIFGIGLSWLMLLSIFLLDAFVSRRAWCGHLCPVGAFYSLLGRFSLLRVNAVALERCDSCMECYAVCPEQKVIAPVLRQSARTHSIILDINCTNCGRCIDICSTDVFQFDIRFNNRADSSKDSDHSTTHSKSQSHQKEVLS